MFEAKTLLELISDIDTSVFELERVSDKLPKENNGASGRKFRTLVNTLNGLIAGKASYLELGILKGKTILTSCIQNPNTQHIGLDNFSQFDPDGINLNLINNVIKMFDIANLELRLEDFESFLISRAKVQKKDVGVYFYDAIHDYRSQLFALMQAHNVLCDGGVILVDDVNYGHVRYASYDFISAFPEFKLIFESYTRVHPNEMTPEQLHQSREGWWNGVHIIVHDPQNQFVGLQPTWQQKVHEKFHETLLLTRARSIDMPTKIATLNP
jgi:hypothetical protein